MLASLGAEYRLMWVRSMAGRLFGIVDELQPIPRVLFLCGRRRREETLLQLKLRPRRAPRCRAGVRACGPRCPGPSVVVWATKLRFGV
jgi:hypothetical protein